MASLLPFGSAPAKPAGSSGQIQFNNSAKFGADSNLFWDNTNKRLGIGTSSPAGRLSVQGTSAGDLAVLGSNQLTSNAFNNVTFWTITTGGDWTLAAANATHVVGNTDPLVATLANFTSVAGQWYRIQFTTSLNTSVTDSFTPVIGSTSGPAISVTGSQIVRLMIQAGNTAGLSFLPTSNWNGRIASVSVTPITPAPATYVGTTSGGTDVLEMRHINDTTSLYIGLNAGRMTTSSNNNNTVIGTNALPLAQITSGTVAIGANALASLAGGSNNTAIGANVLKNAVGGTFNTGIGGNSLTANTFGATNTGIGGSTLAANTTGSNNTAVGSSALSTNTTGGSNTGVATNALGLVSTGSNNIGIGNSAGITSSSSNAVTTGSNNTFIGSLSGPSTATQLTNAGAIGYQAVVGASNALVLGSINGINGASSDTFVGIRTTTPIANLHIAGGMAHNYTAVADAAYNILTTDYIIALTSITAARIFTLPTAVGVTGQVYVIKDEGGQVTGTNTLTIATTSSQTIDGSATAVITVPYTSLTVYSNGSNWGII